MLKPFLHGAFALLAFALVPLANAQDLPLERGCKRNKAIERALGSYGFRVVVSGGYTGRGNEAVKVQVWENERRDWVITEAFLRQNTTCVVRSGIRLHMMY